MAFIDAMQHWCRLIVTAATREGSQRVESRGPDTDRRTSFGGTSVGAEMCKVQVQLHTLCFVSFMGIVFSHHHCVMILFLMNGWSSANQSADLFANISCNMATNDSTSCSPVDDGEGTGSPYKALEMFFIALVTGSLSFVTVTGNILVMLSIKVNRHLQTVNNYFLFSLACADLIIGVFSMNLYTVYIIVGYWPLGPVVCDLWLALDYVVSNASVMNLLIISFDRYFCVTKPLTYPARRTTKMAGLMIAAAWIMSFILWAPAILFWQFIVGQRTVPPGECYIQNNNNETSPQASPHSAPKLSLDSTTTALEPVKNGRVEAPKPVQPQPLTQPSPGLTQAATNPKPVSTATANPAEPKINPTSKWSKIKIVTKQTGDECITAIEIVPPVEGAERHSIPISRPRTVARKFASIARSQVKRKRQMAAREKKVTKTIFAILLAFIITWTPYNVMVLISTFCQSCVPDTVWAIGYWLCYVNSTINPACYALCNATFKKTFKNLLLCQYKNIAQNSKMQMYAIKPPSRMSVHIRVSDRLREKGERKRRNKWRERQLHPHHRFRTELGQ
ncbi:Muscarinic acetylcholine receptor M4 [Collichthys lucidus]|uniref:Muscarinic acetylcholine receptor n=1 Tax=Collichthys lucidus TaxID=240159 RepID=A0A4U5UIV8_COLLU|nr:Muscarinic acetylcholine receptor M4 [Collichthys lucidus]